MDIASWLPCTGIIFIDMILGFFYFIAGGIIATLLLVAFFFIAGFLFLSCYIWIPILAIIVIIMKLCGL